MFEAILYDLVCVLVPVRKNRETFLKLLSMAADSKLFSESWDPVFSDLNDEAAIVELEGCILLSLVI